MKVTLSSVFTQISKCVIFSIRIRGGCQRFDGSVVFPGWRSVAGPAPLPAEQRPGGGVQAGTRFVSPRFNGKRAASFILLHGRCDETWNSEKVLVVLGYPDMSLCKPALSRLTVGSVHTVSPPGFPLDCPSNQTPFPSDKERDRWEFVISTVLLNTSGVLQHGFTSLSTVGNRGLKQGMGLERTAMQSAIFPREQNKYASGGRARAGSAQAACVFLVFLFVRVVCEVLVAPVEVEGAHRPCAVLRADG